MALDKGFDLFLKFSFIFFNKLGGIWSKTKRNKDNGTATFGRRVKCSGQASPPALAWPGRAVAESRPKTWEGRKPITVLGSTGSIGTQTLDIIAEHEDKFRVVALAAGSNVTLLADQVKRFKPQLVAIRNDSLVDELKEALANVEENPEIMTGEQGVIEAARHPDAATVVTGIVGCAGLKPTVAAIEPGKDIALANKETMIAGDWPVEKMKEITVADALKHPIWTLGKNITRDSATLFNKGLEVIEAHYLFGAGYDNIEIVIHPQSILHSMIETQDSSVIGQLGWADMRIPLLYTMSWPERIYCSEVTWPPLDLAKLGSLTFMAPDTAKFPSVNLCYAAGRAGGTMTGVLSAANEKAVRVVCQWKDSLSGYFQGCGVNL